MGVYTNANIFNESAHGVDIDLDLVQESSYEPGIIGAMHHILESEQNWTNIMEAVAFDELGYFNENETEMIYEASRMSGFFAKVKAFFKKIIEKVASLFKKFIALIDAYTKSDADFIKKYRNQLLKVNTKGFEYKGYVFTTGKADVAGVAGKMDAVINKNISRFTSSIKTADLQSTTTKVKENREDIIENMRGTCVGQNSVESGEFQKELFQLFRNGEESPVAIDKVNVSDLLSIIAGGKDAKKAAEKAYKDIKKAIEDDIKELDKEEKEYTKAVPDKDETKSAHASAAVSYISTYTSLLREKANLLQIYNGVVLSALKQENRQAKAVCVKLLTYSPKNESGLLESATGSYLDSVELK